MLEKAVLKQYQEIVKHYTKQIKINKIPKEGWIRTIRKALNMSGSQLAKKISATRAWISRTEKAEINGAVTLKTMQEIAKALNCTFVYALVPVETIEKMLFKQAMKKAKMIVFQANDQMALEKQALSGRVLVYEVERIAKELLERMPSNFWDDEV